MSGDSYVIDTNIISFFLSGDEELLPYFNFTNIHISFVTELELKSIPDLTKENLSNLEKFLNTCIITDINASIKEASIRYRKHFKLKLPDAIIAATAAYLGYSFLTADKVFTRLPLPVIFYKK